MLIRFTTKRSTSSCTPNRWLRWRAGPAKPFAGTALDGFNAEGVQQSP